MKKTIFALAAAATVAFGTMTAPQPAQARCFGCGVGLGILGGVVVGSIIGNAIANHPGYYRYDDYYGDAPYDCRGYWARKAWRDQDGNVHYGRPQYFCD
jgi:anaerobic selenocysteine-containing dehydrogenase